MSIQRIGYTPQFPRPGFKAKLEVDDIILVDHFKKGYSQFPNDIKSTLDEVYTTSDDNTVLKMDKPEFRNGIIEKLRLTNKKTGFKYNIHPTGTLGFLGLMKTIGILSYTAKDFPADLPSRVDAKKLFSNGEILNDKAFESKLKIMNKETIEMIEEENILNPRELKSLLRDFNLKFNNKARFALEAKYGDKDKKGHRDYFMKIRNKDNNKVWEFSKHGNNMTGSCINAGLARFLSKGYKEIVDASKIEEITNGNLINRDNKDDIMNHDVFVKG